MPLALIALAGCAQQPLRTAAPTAAAVAIPLTPLPPVAQAKPAAPAQPPAAATPALPASSPQPAAASPSAQTGPAAAATASDNLPGPPPNSLVKAEPTNLWDRLREGFQLPEVNNRQVEDQINWFANHPEFLTRTFDRASLWLYYIVDQLSERHMPLELAMLPVIESAYRPYAFSPARAVGLWQFIYGTGKLYGLKQDQWYDGRLDPIAATNAALDYLQKLHDEFDGDWLLAIAAYNCGEIIVNRAIQENEREGRPIDFWHLPLPRQTRSYVPELLAMRSIVADPERYGLYFQPIPDQPPFKVVPIQGQVSLQVVANVTGMSLKDVYQYNPGFIRWATDPTGPQRLVVPVEDADGLEQALDQLTPEQRLNVETYTVHRGDTLYAIARRFSTMPMVIRQINDLGPSDRLVIGQQLRVPSPDARVPAMVARIEQRYGFFAGRSYYRPEIHIVRRGDTLYSLARRFGTNVPTLARINGISPRGILRPGQRLHIVARPRVPYRDTVLARAAGGAAAPGRDGRRVTYRVRAGDTLWSIAHVLRVTVYDLMSWNGIVRSRIHPGQTLVAFVGTRG